MQKHQRSKQFLLFGIFIVFSVIVLYYVPSFARTPPDHGLPKPDDFLLHLPFSLGQNSTLISHTYGRPEFGQHGNHTGPDYYAIDFNLNGGAIRPASRGTVIIARWYDEHLNPANTSLTCYGRMVLVRHSGDFGDYVSIYTHLNSINVTEGQDVELGNIIGIEGDSGSGRTYRRNNVIESCGTWPRHLHFALRHCPNAQVGIFPTNCQAVVPEPILGRHVYEGLGWWHISQPGTQLEGGNRPTNDPNPPNIASWGATPPPIINYGEEIVFNVNYGDAEGDISEVRLTAHYPDWAAQSSLPSFNPDSVWRIIARCDPREANANCGSNHWQVSWNPYEPETVSPGLTGILNVPWLPQAKVVNPPEEGYDVCISFDVFDSAGNPLYGYPGPQCSNVLHLNTRADNESSSSINNEGRAIHVMPLSATLPTPDDAVFVADVTLPDGTFVSPSQNLGKIWRMRNTGSTTWGSGYQLVFIGGEQMGAPGAVNVPVTAPDQETNISINLTAPSTGGDHVGYWRLRNPQGTYFGPTIWVDINVNSGSGYITALTTDPPSPANANLVRIYARVENFPNFRAMRLKIDGIVVYEIGAPVIDFDWQTSAYTTGEHSIVVEVADQTDTSWSNPEIRGMTYTLTGTGGSNNHAPNRPSPISPYDWYVNIGSPPQLCGQGSDPDGDLLQYQFEAVASVGSYNSGWVNNSCHTFGTVEAGTYEWKVQTRDTSQAESEWSESWHFSVETSGVTITELYFESLDPDSEQVRIRACTSGHAGVGITLNARVNDANDGSDNGQWHIIKELGVPCFNPIDAPIWNTLEYGDGDHRVRIVATAVNPSASDMLDGSYTLPHRRPAAPRLAAPIPISRNTSEAIYLNSRTITFIWEPTIRANSYTLHVSTNSSPKDDPNPILRQTLGSGTTQYTHTFAQDHATLYWQVTATNDRGSNHSGAQRFGIDRAIPACTVEPLTPVTYETVFQVGWNGMDALAGIRSFDIQYLDSDHGGWSDWLTAVPVTTTYSLFTGLPGHAYDFRCRATDNSNNTGNYPGNGDTSTVVDPTSRPPTPWWNSAYDHKRNLTILNNMPAVELPVGYPIHLHFDSTTTPTAAELFAASQSTPKCNDLRIIYNDTTQLNRVIQNCSVSAIDIWFRSQVTIPASSANNASHQMYYGNASPDSPPADPNQVWYPYDESDTEALYFFQEGNGATTNDSSGHGRHCTIDPTVQWMPSKFGQGLRFNRANAGDSDSLTCGAAVLTNFTVEFWYRPDPDDGGRIAGQLTGGGGNNWLVQNLNGHIRLDVWPCPTCGSSDVQSNFDLRNALYVGKWNHIAVTYNGNNEVKFYINGALDSTKYLPQSGINTFAIPLEIGSVEGISQVKANMGTFRITNGVRTSFPYGVYATITNEPATAAGFLIEPPASGNPELAMLSLVTYPNPEGGILVQSVIENQGDRDTENGFFTDLYLDHLPSGPGDYTNSIQYWVNDSIPAGEIVTLTTVLADDAINGLLYAQLDSTGVINEANEGNNIFSDGLPICVVAPDDYETDDTWTSSTSLLLHTSQTHNIHRAGDEDWFAIQATVGQSYTIKTVNLGVHADTYLYVYGANGTTLIVSNDDYGGSLASHVEWTAPTSGTYYVMVRHWNPNASGCDMQYTILFGNARLYLPLVLRP
ncbi:MAG: peptidoglycan DD-metalloendopeptidase family protein [Anaerolineae bacterium]|nr:peptidoglycan DD-metalloendopeptidase family protein [Anaerolineae bacterium]